MFDEYLGANATARSPSPWVAFPPSIADRVPLTPARFASGVLPVLACYYFSAVLVCKPGTRAYRLALLPVALTLAYRAGTVYDATLGGALPNSANLAFSVSALSTSRPAIVLTVLSMLWLASACGYWNGRSSRNTTHTSRHPTTGRCAMASIS